MGAPSRKATGEREELALVHSSPCWWAPIFDMQERGRKQVGLALVLLSVEELQRYLAPRGVGDETDPGCCDIRR